MAEPLQWDWQSVQNLISAMWQINFQMDDITTFAKDHVLDTSGLIGALEPLASFFDEVKGKFDDAGTVFHDRWGNLISATEKSTDYLKRTDNEYGRTMCRTGGPYRASIL